jgi:hypothetical protein
MVYEEIQNASIPGQFEELRKYDVMAADRIVMLQCNKSRFGFDGLLKGPIIVMPDLIRHPETAWIPAPAPDPDPGFAGMTQWWTIMRWLITHVLINISSAG